jgi:hypothetical protein
VDFRRGEVAGIELEADEMVLGCALSLEHGRCIGTRGQGLDALTTKRAPEGPLRTYGEDCWNYQLPPSGQPPLFSASQVRSTTPSVFVIVNVFSLEPFDVTVTA